MYRSILWWVFRAAILITIYMTVMVLMFRRRLPQSTFTALVFIVVFAFWFLLAALGEGRR